MIKNSLTRFGVAAAALALPALSWASDKETIQPKGKNVVAETKEPCITGDLGANVVSQYVTRGLILENQGGIIQPYADLYIKVYNTDAFKAQINVGVWDSFHSRHTDQGSVSGTHTSSTPNWFESDFTAGMTFTFMKNLAITPSYFTFMSPNDAFTTFQGLNVKATYDDTELLHAFALHPEVQILWELDNKAGTGPSKGIYYEVGIAPAIPTGPLKDLSLTVPVTVGFGTHNFYGQVVDAAGNLRQDNLGYVSVGANASYALSFIPKCYGAWTVNASATYYYLERVLANFNTPATGGDIRGSHRNEVVFSGGLALAF